MIGTKTFKLKRKTMIQSSKDLQRRLVALTRDLILIPSDASHPEDITRCFEFVINHVERA